MHSMFYQTLLNNERIQTKKLQAQLHALKEKEKQYLICQGIHEQVVKGLETQISILQEKVNTLEAPRLQTIHYRN